jgi:hypothetical protein
MQHDKTSIMRHQASRTDVNCGPEASFSILWSGRRVKKKEPPSRTKEVAQKKQTNMEEASKP